MRIRCHIWENSINSHSVWKHLFESTRQSLAEDFAVLFFNAHQLFLPVAASK